MPDWTWWLVAMLGLAAVEAVSGDLIFLMLAAGALAASIVAVAGAPVLFQIIVLAAVSAVMLAFVRPIALRMMHKGGPALTGVDLLPGSEAEVLEKVDGRNGRVRVRGEIWSARSSAGSTHLEGTTVTVVEVNGATVIVR
jgi:membrane protein implicated in regulation of membrane protease activity